MSDYLRAVEIRDLEVIPAFFVTDDRFMWLEDGVIRYRSVNQLIDGLAAFPPGQPVRTALSNLKVAGLGDVAASASAEFETIVGDSTEGFTFGGAITFVLEHHEDSWLIVSGHTSSR